MATEILSPQRSLAGCCGRGWTAPAGLLVHWQYLSELMLRAVGCHGHAAAAPRMTQTVPHAVHVAASVLMACWMQMPSSVRQPIPTAEIYRKMCTDAVLRCGLRTQMCCSAGQPVDASSACPRKQVCSDAEVQNSCDVQASSCHTACVHGCGADAACGMHEADVQADKGIRDVTR